MVGGIVLNRLCHEKLTVDWRVLLDDFGLPALHMTDKAFGKRSSSEKQQTIERAVGIIDTHKIYSLSCSLKSAEYEGIFSKPTKTNHSQYQLCFILAALANNGMAKHNNYDGPISFVMDKGNPKKHHVKRGHEEMKEVLHDPALTLNLSDLDFMDDEAEMALQAADLVSWGAHRLAGGLTFRTEYGPLEAMLKNECAHYPAEITDECLRQPEAYFTRRSGFSDRVNSGDYSPWVGIAR